jgi:hypothetical protein
MNSFHPGQPVIWYRQDFKGAHAREYIQVPATFLEPRGRESARISVGGEQKTVRLASIEAVRERPVLIGSGRFANN